jgi:N-acetylglucosaminyldiphosphoundecaprenol N-acetyl-beta-D-mannosaminyltransferase
MKAVFIENATCGNRNVINYPYNSLSEIESGWFIVQRNTTSLLGIPVDKDSLEQITDRAVAAIERGSSPTIFSCANPHSLVVAQHDEEFRQALMDSHIVVADGSGITLLSKLCGINAGPRITGADFFLAVMSALQRRGGGRVCFFGSSQRVLDLIRNRFEQDFPEVDLVGMISPPFRAWSELENEDLVNQIIAAQPDVLWVGMTAPKQETWVQQNRSRLRVPLIGSIGAVFDFYAGTKPRAPEWMCRMGIEWLHRLLKEPKRMWKRNFVSTPRFIALMLNHHVFASSLHQQGKSKDA